MEEDQDLENEEQAGRADRKKVREDIVYGEKPAADQLGSRGERRGGRGMMSVGKVTGNFGLGEKEERGSIDCVQFERESEIWERSFRRSHLLPWIVDHAINPKPKKNSVRIKQKSQIW